MGRGRSAGTYIFSIGVEKILKKYGKYCLKMCENPMERIVQEAMFLNLAVCTQNIVMLLIPSNCPLMLPTSCISVLSLVIVVFGGQWVY